MSKRPSFQFYPADWRTDAALQACGLPAQGLWVNLICIAHDCLPYGSLVLNDAPMTSAQLARLVGISERIFEKNLAELISAGVASRDEKTGAVFSRRMVRDEALRTMRAEVGKLGGNPLLLKQKVKGQVNQLVNTPANPNLTPSSSSSSSREKKDRPVGLSKETEIVTNGHDLLGDPKRPTKRCPSDFLVTEALRAEISVDCPGIDFAFETKAFRDHEFKTAHSDWAAVWRNWMREAFKRLPPSAKPAPYRGKTL